MTSIDRWSRLTVPLFLGLGSAVVMASPNAPVIQTPTSGADVTTRYPVISGKADVGSTVTVWINGRAVGTGPTNIVGDWSVTSQLALSMGSHSVTARAANGAGELGPSSANVQFTVPGATLPTPTIVFPPPENEMSFDDTTPLIHGTAQTGTMVVITLDGYEAGYTRANSFGRWAFRPTQPLTPGFHSVAARVHDTLDISSPSSLESPFVHFAVGPLLILTPRNGSLVYTRTPMIYGHAPAGASVALNIDDPGGTNRTLTVASTGSWSYQAELTFGAHRVTAELQVDGVTYSSSAAFVVTQDQIPTQLLSPTEGSTVSPANFVISGRAEPNTTISLWLDGALRAIVPVSSNGTWTFTPSLGLAEGTHTVGVQKDESSSPSVVVHFHVMSNAWVLSPTERSTVKPWVLSPTEGSTVNPANFVISGHADANTRINLWLDGELRATVPVSSHGTWTFRPSPGLAEGAHTVGVRKEESSPPVDVIHFSVASKSHYDYGCSALPSGNLAPWVLLLVALWFTRTRTRSHLGSGLAALVIPVLASAAVVPAAPAVLAPTSASTVTTRRPVVAGTAEAGSRVTVWFDGNAAGTGQADDKGAWSFTPELALGEGPHSMTARAEDRAGNMGPSSAAVPFTVSGAVPVPTINLTEGGSVQGLYPLFSGRAQPGLTMVITLDSGPDGAGLVDLEGYWRYRPCNLLLPGAHTISASARDGVNVLSTSATVHFTVEDPTAPRLYILTPTNGTTEHTRTPLISGLAPANTAITVSIDGSEAVLVSVDGTGKWHYLPLEPLYLGTHRVLAATYGGHPSSSFVDFTLANASDRSHYDYGCSVAPTGNFTPWALLLGLWCMRRRAGCRRGRKGNKP